MFFLRWLYARVACLGSLPIPLENRGQRKRRRSAARTSAMQLGLEMLEDRRVLSTVWYVNNSATGGNTGQSWTSAFVDLQAALASAQPGDQVWVAQGTYKPTDSTVRTISFVLKDGVGVYGGFVGTESLLSQRVLANHITTLSGDIGTPGENSDNSYHVVTSNGLTASTVLDGFTITAGNANGPSLSKSEGGGMYNNSSSPTLSNVVFSNNSASFGGGMENIAKSSPTLTNVTFSGNFATNEGGGIDNDFSSPTLTNVTFRSNSALGKGGGLANENMSAPTLRNVTFSSNSTPGSGGGMFNGSSSLTLTNATFSNNSAAMGGGMENLFGVSSLTNVTFSNNSASLEGGGLHNDYSSPKLTNVAFRNNTADKGGGMFNNHGSPTLTNVTFFKNSATNEGGGLYNVGGRPTLTNSILWDNLAVSGAQIFNVQGSLTVRFSNVQGGWAGVGNIDVDPLFVDEVHGDLYLQASAPAPGMGAFPRLDTSTAVTSPPLYQTYSTGSQIVTLLAAIVPSKSATGVQVNEGNATFTILDGNEQVVATLSGYPVSNGRASARYDLAGLPAGKYQIDAAYVPTASDSSFNGSETRTRGTLTVAKDSTAVLVTSTGLNAIFSTASQKVTLSAVVQPGNSTPGGVVNEGSVTFTVLNTSNRIVATLDGNLASGNKAIASFDLAGFPAGSYHIHAIYVPSSSNPSFNRGEDKTDGTLTVAPDSTTTKVTSASLKTLFSNSSQSFTFSALVKAGNSKAGGEVNEGTVLFTLVDINGRPIGTPVTSKTIVQGVATVNYIVPASVAANVYFIRAVYLPKTTNPNFTTSADTTFGHTLTVETFIGT